MAKPDDPTLSVGPAQVIPGIASSTRSAAVSGGCVAHYRPCCVRRHHQRAGANRRGISPANQNPGFAAQRRGGPLPAVRTTAQRQVALRRLVGWRIAVTRRCRRY